MRSGLVVRLLVATAVSAGLVGTSLATVEKGFGTPRIARFSGGAQAAVSLQFDDSMISQLQNAVPLLNERHLRATFFINPARPQHKQHLHEWEVEIPGAGHELADHTLNHIGAKNAEEADREIGACYDYLKKVYGPKPRIMSFGQPGGVPWNVTREELAPIFQRYMLVPSENRVFFDEKDTDPVTLVQKAIDGKAWMQLGMHGTGGEWLSTSVPTITRLFDVMVSKRDVLWTAPTIEVFKYTQERDAAKPLNLGNVSSHGFSLEVECDPKKLQTFDMPVKALYDEPLTIEVPVPDDWSSFTVHQGKSSAKGKVMSVHGQKVARFNILPELPANIKKS